MTPYGGHFAIMGSIKQWIQPTGCWISIGIILISTDEYTLPMADSEFAHQPCFVTTSLIGWVQAWNQPCYRPYNVHTALFFFLYFKVSWTACSVKQLWKIRIKQTGITTATKHNKVWTIYTVIECSENPSWLLALINTVFSSSLRDIPLASVCCLSIAQTDI